MEWFSESPYNQRQIDLMRDEINKFKRGSISLENLVKQLKGLFWALKSPDSIWSESFLSEWGGLETMHALDLDRRERGVVFDENGRENTFASSPFIAECIERISHLIHEDISCKG